MQNTVEKTLGTKPKIGCLFIPISVVFWRLKMAKWKEYIGNKPTQMFWILSTGKVVCTQYLYMYTSNTTQTSFYFLYFLLFADFCVLLLLNIAKECSFLCYTYTHVPWEFCICFIVFILEYFSYLFHGEDFMHNGQVFFLFLYNDSQKENPIRQTTDGCLRQWRCISSVCTLSSSLC